MAVIEFEISWKSNPDFTFVLGVDEKDLSVQHALYFSSLVVPLVELPRMPRPLLLLRK